MELKLCWFQRLGSSFYQSQPPDVFYEKSALKSFAIFTGKHLRQSLLSSCNLIKKKDCGTRVFCEFCKVFINTLFYKTWEVIQRLNVFILQQFLALYFAIIYSWQFSISEKSLDISSQFLLHKSHAVVYAGNHFIGSETPDHNTFDQFWKIKFLSKIFQETQNFLVLTDPLITCIYLRASDIHFRDQRNVCHPTWKFLKCDLVQTLNAFLNPSLRTFYVGKGSLVLNKVNTIQKYLSVTNRIIQATVTVDQLTDFCTIQALTESPYYTSQQIII